MVESELPIYLRPAETIICDASGGKLTTVLGSCVAVVLFAPGQFTGVCHSVLPSRMLMPEKAASASNPRFVDDAIHEMLEQANRRKVFEYMLVAKVFGGAHISTQSAEESVGGLNLRTAKQTLSKAGVQIVALDIGGVCGRKLMVDLQSGEVLVKRFGIHLY